MINLGKCADADRTRRVLFHEAGHALEHSREYLSDWCWKFVLSRRTSESLRPLKQIDSGFAYRDEEMAFEDKFIDPYVGKSYSSATPTARPRATEVLSMALERFADPAKLAEFCVTDPEHFHLVMACIPAFTEHSGVQPHEKKHKVHVLQ